jgi:hypothetical protein
MRSRSGAWLRLAVAFPLCIAAYVGCVGDDTPGGAGTSPEAGAPEDAAPGSDSAVPDTATVVPDAGPCVLEKPFDPPELLTGVNDAVGSDYAPFLTPDEKTVFFTSDRTSKSRIYTATRTSLTKGFDPPTLVTLPGPADPGDGAPALDSTGLILYFNSTGRVDASAAFHIYKATRPVAFEPWATVSEVKNVNSMDQEFSPFPWNDELWFGSTRGGGNLHIYNAKKGATDFGAPVGRSELSSFGVQQSSPVLSADGKTIYFGGSKPSDEYDIYVGTRPNTTAAFNVIKLVDELTSTVSESPRFLSPDGCRLYFNRGEPADIWVASKPTK